MVYKQQIAVGEAYRHIADLYFFLRRIVASSRGSQTVISRCYLCGGH